MCVCITWEICPPWGWRLILSLFVLLRGLSRPWFWDRGIYPPLPFWLHSGNVGLWFTVYIYSSLDSSWHSILNLYDYKRSWVLLSDIGDMQMAQTVTISEKSINHLSVTNMRGLRVHKKWESGDPIEALRHLLDIMLYILSHFYFSPKAAAYFQLQKPVCLTRHHLVVRFQQTRCTPKMKHLGQLQILIVNQQWLQGLRSLGQKASTTLPDQRGKLTYLQKTSANITLGSLHS